MKLNNLFFFFSFLLGFFFFLTHPPINFFGGIFLIITFTLLFINKLKSKKELFWYGFISGFIYMCSTMFWLISTYLDTLTFNSTIFLKWILLIAISAINGCFFGGFFLASKYFIRHKKVFFIPFIIVLLEFMRSYVYSLFLASPQSLIGAHWTFTALGYGLISYYLSIFASIGGVYFLSFIVGLINVVIYLLIKKKRRIYVVLFLILLLIPFSISSSLSNFHTVEIIQTDETSTNQELHPFSTSELVIFPENSVGKQLYSQRPPITVLDGQLGIYSTSVIRDKETTNKLFYVRGNTILDSYDKTFLMPFGEYAPWFMFESHAKMFKGFQLKTVNFNSHVIGASICGSFLTPIIPRNLVKGGAQVIVNVASSASFESNQYRKINLDYARIRAIETGRYFIQSSNEGYSFVIDDKGHVKDSLLHSEKGRLFSSFEYKTNKTLYVLFGDWIVWLSLFILLFQFYSKRLFAYFK